MRMRNKYDYESNQELPGIEIVSYNGTSEIVRIPKTINGMEVKRIGERSFEGNSAIKIIIMPGTVSDIGNRAFYKCRHLKQVRLSRKIAVLPEEVFAETGLEEVVIPKNVSVIQQNAFAYCDKLERVIFEKRSRLKSVHSRAFYSCRHLTEIRGIKLQKEK